MVGVLNLRIVVRRAAVSLNFNPMPDQPTPARRAVPRQRRMEIYAFLIVTAVLMPALAVATVGTWGLTVWLYQAINGPPGPPSK